VGRRHGWGDGKEIQYEGKRALLGARGRKKKTITLALMWQLPKGGSRGLEEKKGGRKSRVAEMRKSGGEKGDKSSNLGNPKGPKWKENGKKNFESQAIGEEGGTSEALFKKVWCRKKKGNRKAWGEPRPKSALTKPKKTDQKPEKPGGGGLEVCHGRVRKKKKGKGNRAHCLTQKKPITDLPGGGP